MTIVVCLIGGAVAAVCGCGVQKRAYDALFDYMRPYSSNCNQSTFIEKKKIIPMKRTSLRRKRFDFEEIGYSPVLVS